MDENRNLSPQTWLFASGSGIGLSHKKTGSDCQDYAYVETFGKDSSWLVGALADGAGSAAHSKEGAEFLCTEVIRKLQDSEALNKLLEEFQTLPKTEMLDEIEPIKQQLRQVFVESVDALRSYAQAKEINPQDLASTLVAFIASPNFLASIEIGDSLLVYISSKGEFSLNNLPMKGEYANQTIFAVSKDSKEQVACCVRKFREQDQLVFICAMTDGLESVSFDKSTNTPGSKFFLPLLESSKACNTNSELEAFIREVITMPALDTRTDDDKTLLIALNRLAP